MKIQKILFLLIFSIASAQNKSQKSQFIQKNIESCRIPINDSTSVFKIHENLYQNDIDIIIKTENTITNECSNVTISDELIAKINNSQNPLLEINKHLVNDINIADFKNLIPTKIYSIKKTEYTILVIELYNFSYTTVGSTYINLCFKINSGGKIIKKKILESRSSMKIDKLSKII
ncbi:hypothetical protein [uncultured Flavobacterium sp.]|uniref:hypothetical protein n=1 Tax=uncultured Flavobacterium sp. TaxID=165435 RepID=UPI003081AC32